MPLQHKRLNRNVSFMSFSNEKVPIEYSLSDTEYIEQWYDVSNS